MCVSTIYYYHNTQMACFLYLLSEEIKKWRVKVGMRNDEVEESGSGITGALTIVKWVRSTDHV